MVWDAVLVIVFVLFLLVVTSMVFNPKPDDIGATSPLIVRALLYYPMILLMFGPVFYMVSDRRPIRRLIPRLAGLPWKRELLVCVLVFIVGFLFVGVMTQLVPSS